MNHLRVTTQLWFGLTLVLAAAGCGSSVGGGPGGLFVVVKDVSMTTVADAEVSTDPPTQTAITDALGTVLLDKLPAGFYAVTANHPSFGAARMAITVRAGMLTEVTLTLRKVTTGAGGSGQAGTGQGGGGQGGGGQGGGRAGGGGVGGGAGTTVTVGVAGATGAGGGGASGRGGAAGSTAGAGAGRGGGGGTGGGGAGGTAGGQFISVNSQVERLIVDPKRPYLYAVDKVNNSLHFINLTTKMLEKTIFIGSSPVDLCINLAGTELFVANFGSTEISVVNLETREKTRGLLVDISKGTWDGNPYRLACTSGDTLVYTSEDQWNDLKLVSASTGAFIATTGSIYYPALATSPDGTRVYVGESGSTGTAVIRFDVAGSTIKQMDSSTTLSFGTRQVSVTADGMYVFYARQKYLANNLKSVLGTFSEVIITSNKDGSIAIGPSKIHDGTTFAAIKSLPVTTSVMAISPDDKTLYLYDTTSSRIYVHQL
jgi:6-phosphogluconolactonase (cycloisomerase 2 family)